MTFETNGKQSSAPHRSRDARSQGDPVRPRGDACVGGVLVLFALLGLAHPQRLAAQAIRSNAGFNAASLGQTDDGSTFSGVPLGFTVNFFGNSFNQVFVNNNGNVTFSGPLSSYTPEGLTASSLPIIAPFWADVDTLGAQSSAVTYGQDTVNGRPAFGANYINVGYYASHDDKLNRLQVVLIDRSDTGAGNFDIEFNYDRVVWETGDASGGISGLGGLSAAVGYSNGSGTAAGSFELSGSRVPGSYLDSNPNGLIRRSAGSSLPGRLIFPVRNGQVSCSFSISPTTVSVAAGGGTGTVSVAAQTGCSWTATSNSSFLTITAGGAGNGGGTVAYAFPANTGPQRTGTLTIAGQTFTVTQPGSAPQPTLRPQSFRFSGFLGGGVQRQALQIGVASGSLSWQTRATILNGTGWLTVSPPSGTATSSVPSTVTLEVNFGAFASPGAYQAEVAVEQAGGGVLARVPVTVLVSPAGSQLLLSQTSFLFRTIVGGAAPAQSLKIVNGGQGSMSWTIPSPATLTAPLNWLAISSLSGSAAAGTSGSLTTFSINTAGLTAGVYQALVPVSASGAANSPQLVAVTLHVAPASTPASPELSSNGILFVVREGATQIPAFDFSVGNAGGGSTSFQIGVTTESGGNWLTVSSTSGSISTTAAAIRLGLNLQGLSLGTYRARVTATFNPGGTREVDVALIYSGVPVVPLRDGPTAAACAPNSMQLVVNSIGTGSVIPVSFPRPLLATVADSCGTGLNDATVVATAEGRTIPLTALGEGLYSGTWVPEQQSASSAISFVALHPTYTTVERTVTVSTAAAAGGASLPVLFSDGVVEGAAFTSRRPLSPGGIVSLFGSRFATADALAARLPLDRTLGGVTVRIGGEDAPLYFAGPGQINAQVPYSVRSGESVSVVMRVNGQLTAPQTYQIAPAQPGIFLAGNGGAILDGQSRLVNADNPAQRGDVLQIFATGLGETNPPGRTGEGAPSFSQVLLPVTVTVGGVEAPVQYQGLAPGFVGLYQVNVQLPTTVTPGDNVEVVIRQNGIQSNPDRPATIPVR